MATLKNPQLQIPGGFQFLQPETGWQPSPFSSLDSIVQQLLQHRRGQAYLATKHQWPMDPVVMYQEVLAYNVAVCERNGWNDYLLGGAETVPFQHPTPRSLLERAKGAAAGAKTIVSWMDDGAPAVSQEIANRRAAICTGGADPEKKCPMNGAGDLLAYFTVPATNAIKAQIERKKEMKLETPGDDHLGVCTACDCPLKLKVWMPMDRILSKMPKDAYERLAPFCWIRNRDQ